MERCRRSVLPILAAKLRFMGATGVGACWTVRLAYLERQVALGRHASSGYCLRDRCRRDFCFRLFRSNRAVGLGSSHAYGVGLLPYSALPSARLHWTLGLS